MTANGVQVEVVQEPAGGYHVYLSASSARWAGKVFTFSVGTYSERGVWLDAGDGEVSGEIWPSVQTGYPVAEAPDSAFSVETDNGR